MNQLKKTFYNNSTKVKQEFKNTLVLPYNAKFKKITKLSKQLNLSVQFKYNNKLKNILIKKNSPIDNNSVVYKIKCFNCEKIYIGTTGNMISRLKQHKYAMKSRDKDNAMFLHYLDTGHIFNYDNYEIIKNCRSYKKRNIIEGICINSTWDNNVNVSKGLFNIDNIGSQLIKKEIKNNLI